jgi:DnaK suppressor protein
MIVSILQLLTFPFGQGASRREGENLNRERAVPDNQGITRIHEGDPSPEQGRSAVVRQSHAVAATGRRQEVKPQSKAGKPAAKAKPASKPVKAVKAAKPAAKKPAAKKAAPAKKAPPAKALPKKAAAGKTVAKKPPVAQPASKKTVPAPKAKPAAKAATSNPKTAAAKTPKAKAPAGPALPRAMPPRPDAATLGAEPARATKPSARLAQITVPSMAQSVASTAAKASYTQTMSPSVLPPPPLVAIKKDPKLANNWKTKAVEQLSDDEVLAMPDSEYMNEKQMAFFRFKLTQLKQEILNSAGETTEHLREDTVIVPDPADRATIEEEHALELRTRDRERKLLKKIEQSIARIDAGDYGFCDETGEPIGVGRLLARPTATLSLEAQQRRELKQKMFGD